MATTDPVTIQGNDNFAVGLSWDQTSDRPTDLDLACVAIGPTGLILDACFFNNPNALGGALVHSGDCIDGAAGGIDESITITSSKIPPFTCALLFCLMQPSATDLTACETARLHLQDTQNGDLMQAMSLGGSIPQGCHFSVLGIARRQSGGSWGFNVKLHPFPAPAKNFMDVFAQLLPLINIDPLMAEELKASQPVFKLTKDGSWTLPVGLQHVTVGLGWDSRCDVDASVLAYNASGDLITSVYFGSKVGLDGAIVHHGDNTTGEGDGDDEVISLDLTKFPANLDAFFFTVNVYSGGSFADVDGEYWRLLDTSPGPNKGKELVRFDSLDNGSFRGVTLVGMYRNLQFPSQWIITSPALGSNANVCRLMTDDCKKLHAAFRNGGEPQGFVAQTKTIPDPQRVKITLVGANDVTPLDSGGTSDPYCLVREGKNKVFKTKTHKKTINAVWNESFRTTATTRLTFEVFDHNSILKDELIGTVADWAIPDLGPGVTQMTLPIVNKRGASAGSLVISLEKV